MKSAYLCKNKKHLVDAFLTVTVNETRRLVELHEFKLTTSEKRNLYELYVKYASQKFVDFENLEKFKLFSKCALISAIYKISREFKFRSWKEREKFCDFSKKITEYMDSVDYDVRFERILFSKS